MSEIADHVAVTLAALGGLVSRDWGYFLDVLDLAQQERAWLAASKAPWPPGSDKDRELYRVVLLVIEVRIRRLFEDVELGQEFDPEAADKLGDFLIEWARVGKRILAAGGGGPAH
jgi:hypothetical protein